MNTAESKAKSPTSAIASFIVFVWFALTGAAHVRTVVRPSIWVSIVGGPGSFGSLLR